MSTGTRLYNSFSYRISKKIETNARVLRWYKRFCFRFLKPKDLRQTPIFINNRNHYTYLKELIDWLERNGFYNYYVIDNDSSYPPLLRYYDSVIKEKVIHLHRNVGHLSLWKERLINRVKHSFYVYTDSDVLPVLQSNPNLLSGLYQALEQYEFALKAGSALKIDDLPDHFALKSKVVQHEEQFWKNELQTNVYHAHVDTTLALYLPNYYWEFRHWDKHIRVAGDCLVRHQPWYQDSRHLTEEQQYYVDHAVTHTHWTQLQPPTTP